jgi:protein SCO1/2
LSDVSPKPESRSRSLSRSRRWLPVVVFVGLLGLVVSVRVYRRHAAAAAHDRTSFLTNFEPLTLVDQAQQPFNIAALRGKVVLFNFIFTSCPNVCPVQTLALADVQRGLPPRIRDRVHFVSVSIDPTHDTPNVLRSFAARFRVDFSHWTFVTGGTADIDRLSDRLRLFAQNTDRRPENHGTTLWLMDGNGRLMQRYAGDPPEVPRLINELDSLAKLTN